MHAYTCSGLPAHMQLCPPSNIATPGNHHGSNSLARQLVYIRFCPPLHMHSIYRTIAQHLATDLRSLLMRRFFACSTSILSEISSDLPQSRCVAGRAEELQPTDWIDPWTAHTLSDGLTCNVCCLVGLSLSGDVFARQHNFSTGTRCSERQCRSGTHCQDDGGESPSAGGLRHPSAQSCVGRGSVNFTFANTTALTCITMPRRPHDC
jgi:hypothetical protein